jgi:hypothetical protein
MNRSIHFPALFFLALLALSLLLTVSAIFSRVSQPRAGFAKAVGGAPIERTSSIKRSAVTKSVLQPGLSPLLFETGRPLFGVRLFPNPGLRAPVNYQRAYSSLGAELNKAAAKVAGVPSHSRTHPHLRSSRLRVSFWTRVLAGPASFFERWRVHEHHRKEIQPNGRSPESRLAKR